MKNLYHIVFRCFSLENSYFGDTSVEITGKFTYEVLESIRKDIAREICGDINARIVILCWQKFDD